MAMQEIARFKAPISGQALTAFLHHHPGAQVSAASTRPPSLVISVDDSPADVPTDPGEPEPGAAGGSGGTSGGHVGDVHVHNAT